MNKLKFPIILTILAAIFVGLTTFLIRYDMAHEVADEENITTKNSNFGPEHLTWMKVDTFVSLANKAYGPNIKTNITNHLLTVEIQNANAIAADFYNGNQTLLKQKINEANFDIIHDQNKNTVAAHFKIKNNLVAIPNDVLIKVVDKNLN